MAIAIFGGSFDPPHEGHVAVVKRALQVLPVEVLYVVPAYVNPFKNGTHAPAQLRLAWLESIFSSEKRVRVSDYEIRQKRPVPTIETVRHFAKSDPTIFLIIGSDNLERLSSWHDFETLNALVSWVVASRRGHKRGDASMHYLDVQVDISSTQLRALEKTDLIPKAVRKAILNFYKEEVCKND